MELKTNEEREQYRLEFEAKVRILNKDLNDSVQRLLSKTTRDAIAATTQVRLGNVPVKFPVTLPDK